MTHIDDINAKLDTIPKSLPTAPPSRKFNFMARFAESLTARRLRLFLTPSESREAAQAQIDLINQQLATQRQQLRESIIALVAERVKVTHRNFEVKLTINRMAIETCVGEQAAVEIAIQVARQIVQQHRRLVAATKPVAKEAI